MKKIFVVLVIISGLFAHNYHGCALAPDNLHGWVVCLDTALIRYTTDGGVSWQYQIAPDSAKRIFDITCVDQLQAWTVGILGQILHTDNGGTNWSPQIIGLSKYGTRIEFIDQSYGWAACGDGVVGKTTDGGGYWDQINTSWYSAEFYGVSFVNDQDGWIVAGYPDSVAVGQGLILRSTDGGFNWDSLLQTPSYEDFFDVHFFHLLNGVVVGGDESNSSAIILRTTDGGSNWSPVTVPGNTYYLRAVDFIGDEGWAVGMFGSIIHTTDAGITWSFQSNPATNTLFDVDFSDNLHGLVCGYGIILYTTDGGQNWIQTGIEETNDIGIQHTCLQVSPNPFSLTTNINWQTTEHRVKLQIYDISGNLIKKFSPVTNQRSDCVVWDGTDMCGTPVPAGIYFVRMTCSEKSFTEKIILLN